MKIIRNDKFIPHEVTMKRSQSKMFIWSWGCDW